MAASSTRLSSLATLLAAAGPAYAIVLSDGVTGKLPALGWNSWNAYGCDITEDKFLTAADKLVSLGLHTAGYTYVNIDDCWQRKDGRDSGGHLVPNATRFPDGISGLATTIHGMNLKIGIYNTAGDYTCQGYPSSLGHETVDAADYAAWGIDYLKYDNCYIPYGQGDQYVFCNPDYVTTTANGTCTTALDPTLAPDGYDWTTSNTYKRFKPMRDALLAQSRPILYSLCEWGKAGVYDWGNATAASWRISDDIAPNWTRIAKILNMATFRLNSVNFWSHNDADMLEVGNGGLTGNETQSHFAFWAAMKSPLLIGTDLSVLSDANVAILKNKYLLAFNQDSTFGAPATPYKWGANPNWTFNNTHPAEFWSGKSKAGTLILMLNPESTTVQKVALWSEVPGLTAGATYHVRDAWTGRDLGCKTNRYPVDVGSHGTAVILVGATC